MPGNFKHIIYEKDEHIAKITLNRPPLNVLNIEMIKEINFVLGGLLGDTKLKVLIFNAEGKAFSAGVDVAEHTPQKVEEMIHVFHRMFFNMIKISAPTLALVNGAALGGGCELATFCDIVLASDNAKFGQPEIKVGVFPPIAAVTFPWYTNFKKSMELLLTGDTVSAEEAKKLGLVNHVISAEKFEEETKLFIEKLTANSSVVLQLTKRALDEAYGEDYHTGVAKVENLYLNKLMNTYDANEGLKAFMEKRKPEWKNK
jgi:cyclohexa-1,5-dienecarbonyl-CoA hydratase